MTARVIGIDPGLANLGVGTLTYDGHRCTSLTTQLIQSGPARGVVPTVNRMSKMIRAAVPAGERVTCTDPACGYTRTEAPTDIVLALVETPAWAASTAHGSEASGLYWRLMSTLVARGIPIATTNPSTLKKWATDTGRADKAQMKLALDRLWPGVMTRSQHDRADAEHQVDGGLSALAAGQFLAWHELGDPLRQAKSLAVMSWPKLPERVGVAR